MTARPLRSSPDPAGVAAASDLMDAFARRTGLDPEGPARRYLWTDAFAVCTCLGLHDTTGDPRWRELALRLVDQVHRVLGRHRPDDARSGWISGLSEDEGARHPTMGGLRIGKPLPERRRDEPYDERREWDRDGQYYHYLTKWIHALERVWRATDNPVFLEWAIELAVAAHQAFRTPEGEGLWWKVSIDGSRPQVRSAGRHDPLDGLLTLAGLDAEGREAGASSLERLGSILTELSAMCAVGSWATDDPLGAGGLLVDARRVSILAGRSALVRRVEGRVARDASLGLEACAAARTWRRPAEVRLAFRELGLSIGIRAADTIVPRAEAPPPPPAAAPSGPYDPLEGALVRHHGLADTIERFWMDPRSRRSPNWRAHEDISAVMLATSLVPRGWLGG